MLRIQPRRLLVVALVMTVFVYVVIFVKPISKPSASSYRSGITASTTNPVKRDATPPKPKIPYFNRVTVNKSTHRRVPPALSQSQQDKETEFIATTRRNVYRNIFEDTNHRKSNTQMYSSKDVLEARQSEKTNQSRDLIGTLLNNGTEKATPIRSEQYIERRYEMKSRGLQTAGSSDEAWSDGVMKSRDGAESPILIVILAYMHTGSTYLGSVFQNHPGTYYSYEPLRSLQALFRANDTTVFLNGTKIQLSGNWVTHPVGTDAVENMFLCRYDKLDMTTLIKYYFHSKSKEMRDQSAYFRCQGRREWYDTNNRAINARQARLQAEFFSSRSRARIIQCLPKMMDVCKAAKIRVSKFIRMTVNISEGLLQRLPNVKIVHLLRDPRAMLDSQVRKGDMGTRVFRIFVKETIDMCQRMLSDIRKREQLELLYPDTFTTIRYEDILDAPLESIKSLFKFTGLQFTSRDESYVKHYSVETGKNSSERQATWRQHLDQARIHMLNKYCNKVFEKLGYIQYSSRADLKNLSKPTYLEEMP